MKRTKTTQNLQVRKGFSLANRYFKCNSFLFPNCGPPQPPGTFSPSPRASCHCAEHQGATVRAGLTAGTCRLDFVAP